MSARMTRKQRGGKAAFGLTSAPPPAGKVRERVMIAVPSLTGSIRWSIAHQFARAMQLNQDPAHPFTYETQVLVGCRPFEYARNRIAEIFLASGCDILYFWDDDQEVPDNFWQPLTVGLGEAARPDVISATTFCWVGTQYAPGRLRVNQYAVNSKAQCVSVHPMSFDQPYRVEIVGTACMAIRRHVLERLGPNPFRVRAEPSGQVVASEDIMFCNAVNAAGMVIAVDPRCVFGHVKQIELAQVAETLGSRARLIVDGTVGSSIGGASFMDVKAGDKSFKADSPDSVLSIAI